MTTEEFEGHLLAALHGPNAAKIVARVATVGMEMLQTLNEEQKMEFVALLDGPFGDNEERLLTLEVLAHIKGVRTPRDMAAIADLVAVEQKMRERLRDGLRTKLGASDSGREIAKKVALDLTPR